MKKSILLAIVLLISSFPLSAKDLKPYILGTETAKSVSETSKLVESALKSNGFELVGSYMPAKDKTRYIVCFTSNEILAAVKKIGGIRGFAAAWRVAITKEGSKTIVSYNNPKYWGNAYFQDDFPKVKSYYNKLAAKLKKAISAVGKFKGNEFGSEDGVEAEDLRDYHYMFGMPYFHDVIEIKTFKSHKEAVATIEKNLKSNKNASKVYKVKISGKELTLFGIALTGEDGESDFLPTIDIDKPKHTGFLPYELLVKGKEVIMLHGRYRIAIAFPDLGMGTFTKIMSAPGNIEDTMTDLTK